LVEDFARSTLVRFDVRVLKLNYPTTIGLHVCDVTFAVFRMVDNLLPMNGKLAFPTAVPFRFLPPWIAEAPPFVSPVPNPDVSALCNRGTSAVRTLA
jgi:hypothetical protein